MMSCGETVIRIEVSRGEEGFVGEVRWSDKTHKARVRARGETPQGAIEEAFRRLGISGFLGGAAGQAA